MSSVVCTPNCSRRNPISVSSEQGGAGQNPTGTPPSLCSLPNIREALHNIKVSTGATKPTVSLVKILGAAVNEIHGETPPINAIVLYVKRMRVKKNRSI